MQDYAKLRVWEQVHALVLGGIYFETRSFPVHERYGLTIQLRRSAASIAANIAEGCGGRSAAGFGQFLDVSASSASETDYQLLLARDLGYLKPATYDRLANDLRVVRRMSSALRQRLAQPKAGAVAVTNNQ